MRLRVMSYVSQCDVFFCLRTRASPEAFALSRASTKHFEDVIAAGQLHWKSAAKVLSSFVLVCVCVCVARVAEIFCLGLVLEICCVFKSPQ